MPAINSILSGLIAPAVTSAPTPPQAEGGQRQSSGAVQDVFVQGQWWANRAGAGADRQGGSSLLRVAARAYGRQQMLPPAGENGDASAQQANTPAGGSEEKIDSASGGGGSEDGREKADSTLAPRKSDGTELSDGELRELMQLKTIDTKVRAHEMAHLSVAGSYARGGASFQYKKGPDGRNYAVGGEVPIDVSKESTPQATVRKMEVVRAAALAPADPSPQDRRVAASASQTMSEAEQQLRLEELAQLEGRAQNAVANDAAASSAEDSSKKVGAGDLTQGAEETARKGLIGRYLAGSARPPENNGFTVVA